MSETLTLDAVIVPRSSLSGTTPDRGVCVIADSAGTSRYSAEYVAADVVSWQSWAELYELSWETETVCRMVLKTGRARRPGERAVVFTPPGSEEWVLDDSCSTETGSSPDARVLARVASSAAAALPHVVRADAHRREDVCMIALHAKRTLAYWCPWCRSRGVPPPRAGAREAKRVLDARRLCRACRGGSTPLSAVTVRERGAAARGHASTPSTVRLLDGSWWETTIYRLTGA